MSEFGIREDGMFKFVATLLVAVCIVGFGSAAHASPCVASPTGISCGLSEGQNSATNPEYGVLSAADLGIVGGTSGWDEGWTFILDNGTNYTGVADNSHVSDIVHISPLTAELWSQTFDASLGGDGTFGATFAAILANTLGLNKAATVQVVGDPLFPGARRFTNGAGGEIGLVNEAATGLAHLIDISGPGFAGDSLDVQSTADNAVPEPATLTLMGIGGAIAAIRRRRKMA
jgi:hypothetical protein